MTIQLLPASWELLAKLDIDPMTLAAVPPDQSSAYIAAMQWLTDCTEAGNQSIRDQIDCFLQACHHFCGVAAWMEVWKVLATPLFVANERTLADQLDVLRLGVEQLEIYSKLSGKLDRLSNALCLNGLGKGYLNYEGHFRGHEAQAYFQAALTAFVELNAIEQIGWTLHQLGINALYALGNQQEAQTYFVQAIAQFRQIGDYKGLAHTLHNLAEIFNQQGHYTEARPLYHESLAILYHRLPTVDAIQRAWAHLTYAQFLSGQGEFDDAQQQLRRSVRIFRKIEHRSGLCWSLIQLAGLLLQRRRCCLAHVVLQRLATEYCNLAEATHDSAFVQHKIGWHGLMTQDYVQALHSFQTMLAISQKLNNLAETAYALEGAAFVAFYIQRDNVSIQLWAAVDTIRRSANLAVPPFYRVRNENVLATLQSRLGQSLFQFVWCAGQSMVIEEAMTIAMNMSLDEAVAAALITKVSS